MAEAKTCESIQTAVHITLDLDTPRINDVIKSGNSELVILYIAAEISEFISMLPSQKAVSPQVIYTMAKRFVTNPDVKNLSFTELKTFLSLAFTRMKFGKLYAGFGYDTLLEWFAQFDNERVGTIIEYRESKHNQQTATEKMKRHRIDGDAFGANSIQQIIQHENKS